MSRKPDYFLPAPPPRCPYTVFVDKPSYYQPFFPRKMLATRESGKSLVHNFLKNALKSSFFLARTKQATSRSQDFTLQVANQNRGFSSTCPLTEPANGTCLFPNCFFLVGYDM